jgi:hypothetical protein
VVKMKPRRAKCQCPIFPLRGTSRNGSRGRPGVVPQDTEPTMESFDDPVTVVL